MPLGEANSTPARLDMSQRRSVDHAKALSMLPANGALLNDRGYPFHHDCGYIVIPEWIDRLEKHGIRLKTGAFSDDEKERICQNWRIFANKHDLSPSDIFRLTKKGDSDDHKKKLEFVRNNALWPNLCHGLENRTAFAVRYVISNVFGPKTTKDFRPLEYLADPKNRSIFMRCRQKYEDDRSAISMALNISLNQVTYIYNILLHMEQPIVGHAFVRMWNYIPRCIRKDASRVKQALSEGRAVADASIAWMKLGFLTKRLPATCKKTFKEEYPKICALIAEQGLSVDDAIVQVSGCRVPRMQPHDLCCFVRIVYETVDDGERAGVGNKGSVDRVRSHIESEMERLGVYGFYTGLRTPYSHCRMRLSRLIRNIRLHVLPKLTIVYSFKELLMVVIRTLEDYYMSGEAENEMEEEEEQGGADGAASGAVQKRNGIRVATGDLVSHLFLYTREEICKDFVPPWKFKLIVPARFSSVLAMFDETRKNEFYISSTDVNKKKKLIRESTALQREREGEVENLLKEEEDGESTDEEELVRVCSGKKKEKGGAKEQTFVQETTLTGDEDDVVTVFVKNKKGREEKDQMEQEKEEDVSVSERKKKKKEKKEKRRLEEQGEQEETEMEQDDVEKKRRKKEKKDRKRLREMEQEEEEREEKGHKKRKVVTEE